MLLDGLKDSPVCQGFFKCHLQYAYFLNTFIKHQSPNFIQTTILVHAGCLNYVRAEINRSVSSLLIAAENQTAASGCLLTLAARLPHFI